MTISNSNSWVERPISCNCAACAQLQGSPSIFWTTFLVNNATRSVHCKICSGPPAPINYCIKVTLKYIYRTIINISKSQLGTMHVLRQLHTIKTSFLLLQFISTQVHKVHPVYFKKDDWYVCFQLGKTEEQIAMHLSGKVVLKHGSLEKIITIYWFHQKKKNIYIYRRRSSQWPIRWSNRQPCCY